MISSSAYNRDRKEVVVAAITRNVRRRLLGDHLIVDWKSAGLLFPSVATGILRTVTRGMMDRKLGAMASLTPQTARATLPREVASVAQPMESGAKRPRISIDVQPQIRLSRR